MHSLVGLSLAVFCPALAGLLALAIPRRATTIRVGISVAAPVVTLLVLWQHIAAHGFDSGPVGVEWMPSLQLALSFNPDRLGLFFALLVAGFGVAITLYARAYFGLDHNALYRLYPILLLFMTGMLGLVLADNLLLLLLFWELTSVSSFLLIGWERDDPAAAKNALQAFVVTGTGGMVLLGGLILLGVSTGTWSFSALSAGGVQPGPGVTAAFLLIFTGAAAKSAQWPLHFWLPGAMAAPTPISAYLHSATMVKAGVYLLGRLTEPMGALPLWPYVLVPVGTITMVLGAYVALRKTDLKLIFAYTTVSQLGLLVCMYGVAAFQDTNGQPALLWDVTQILNHALYKAPLFIIAGAIAHVTFSRDLRDLHGLFNWGWKERLLVILLLLAAYAMAAGPGTLGFTAKEFFLYSVYGAFRATWNPMLAIVLIAVVCQSALNVAILVRLGLTLLVPGVNGNQESPHDPEAEEERIAFEDYHAIQTGFWAAILWIPAAGIVLFQYVGGLAPRLFDAMLGDLERTRGGYEHLPGLWYAFTHPSVPLGLSMLAIFGGVALALLPVPLGRAPIWRGNIRDWHDALFPAYYRLVTAGGRRVFGALQTGNMRAYLAVICGTLVLLVAWAVWRAEAFSGSIRHAREDSLRLSHLPVYAMGTLVCVGALLMPLIRHRAGRVMLLGSVGFGVAGLFYLHSAPDVALTQVAIEIVALILFLLALGMLPRTKAAVRERSTIRIPRLVLSVAVGIAMGWLVITSTTETRPPMAVTNAEAHAFTDLGDFFLRNSYTGQDVEGRHPGGGGNNVVNVILVDFRGFDTLGEITVLAIAAMGVLVLLHRRRRSASALIEVTPESAHALEEPGDESQLPTARSRVRRLPRIVPWRHRYSLTAEPLRVVTRLLVPLSLLFAAYVFLKGHQSPGGGFVAGLTTAVALAAHRMAHGRTSLRRLLLVREQTMIGVGLLLSLGTGLAATLVGMPFLTSRFGYITIPGLSRQVEWTTVLTFDLGVFLVVLGVVQLMLNALNDETEVE